MSSDVVCKHQAQARRRIGWELCNYEFVTNKGEETKLTKLLTEKCKLSVHTSSNTNIPFLFQSTSLEPDTNIDSSFSYSYIAKIFSPIIRLKIKTNIKFTCVHFTCPCCLDPYSM